MSKISIETLQEALSYNPETGVLTWRKRPLHHFKSENARNRCNTLFAGQPAFTSLNNTGYLHGLCNRVPLLAHRVAWALTYGLWPDGQIDHIDGDRTNNRIVNLRDATGQENSKNRQLRSDNKSGCVGVQWHKKTQKWRAFISGADGLKHLGVFTNLDEAIAARKAAEREHDFHPNHGRDAA